MEFSIEILRSDSGTELCWLEELVIAVRLGLVPLYWAKHGQYNNCLKMAQVYL